MNWIFSTVVLLFITVSCLIAIWLQAKEIQRLESDLEQVSDDYKAVRYLLRKADNPVYEWEMPARWRGDDDGNYELVED